MHAAALSLVPACSTPHHTGPGQTSHKTDGLILGQGLSQVIMALRWTIDIATKLEQTGGYCDETGDNMEKTGDYSE